MAYEGDGDDGSGGPGVGTEGPGSGPGSPGRGGSGPGVGSPGPGSTDETGGGGDNPRELTEKQKKNAEYSARLAASPFDPHSSAGLEIWRTDPEYYNWVREQKEGKINENLHVTGRMGGQSKSPYRGAEKGKGGSEIGGMFGGSGGGGEGDETTGTKIRDVPSTESKDTDYIVIGDALNINLSGPRALKSRIRITSKVSKTSDISDFSLGNKSIISSFMENLEINKFDFNIRPEDRVDMSSIGNVGFGRYFDKGA